MQELVRYPCTRCGTERIVAKTWTETVKIFGGRSVVTHTDTVCPDPECQKIVEAALTVAREKHEDMQRRHEERLKQRKNPGRR